MKSIYLIFVTFIIVASPFWPLEPNPIKGDPLIIVNKRVNELAFLNDGKIQIVERVATGKTSSSTPEGIFTITVKAENPYYRKLNIPGESPNNPLGTRWIGFDAMQTDGRTYGVHGTNDPSSIGKYVSNGCIRMHNEAVEQLYDLVPLGTKILITSSDESFQQLAKKLKVI